MGLSFGSDNHSGVHPKLLEAIINTNTGHEHSYGMDADSLTLEGLIKADFGSEAVAYPVFNGTAANVLCINQLVRPYHSVLAADCAHLIESECGAPEKAIGCKVIPVKSIDGKVSPDELIKHLIRMGDQHSSQVKAISITQPTEFGTVYSLKELQGLRDFCRNHHLKLHIDGARFIYAAHKLNCSFKDIMEASDADALSFGGTKSGLLFGELCIFKNKSVANDFKYSRKQLMQLPSKQRFISAQFNKFLSTGLWKEIASQAHTLSLQLGEMLSGIEGVFITRAIESNAVFIKMPKQWIKEVRKEHFFYVWDEHSYEIRLLISFDMTTQDLESFVATIKKAALKEIEV